MLPPPDAPSLLPRPREGWAGARGSLLGARLSHRATKQGLQTVPAAPTC